MYTKQWDYKKLSNCNKTEQNNYKTLELEGPQSHEISNMLQPKNPKCGRTHTERTELLGQKPTTSKTWLTFCLIENLLRCQDNITIIYEQGTQTRKKQSYPLTHYQILLNKKNALPMMLTLIYTLPMTFLNTATSQQIKSWAHKS